MADMELYQQLAATLGLGESPLAPQMFQELVDENGVKILLAASPPATVEEIAEKTGLKIDEINKQIDPLFKKGLLFKSRKPDATRYYRFRHFLQFHDATSVAKDVPQGFLNLLREFKKTEWPDFQDKMKNILPRPPMRVIPVNVTINPETRILAFDDIKQIVEEAGNIAVTRCACRVIDGSCGKPLEVCVQLNKAADYAVERGTGRKVTKQEALEIFRLCEEEGLVHVAGNRRSLGHVVCNCCEDCCIGWSATKEGVKKAIAPSRFTAYVDPSLCTSCETCLTRCFFDAVSLEGEDDTALVDPEKCMGCGVCLVTCQGQAISMNETRQEEFIPA